MIVHWEVLGYRAEAPPDSGFLLRLTDNRGLQGIGEAHAIEGFCSGPATLAEFMEDATAVAALVDALPSLVPGTAFKPPGKVPLEAIFAAETAMYDLLARSQGISVTHLLTGRDRQFLPNSQLVDDHEAALELVASGHRHFKLKAHGDARDWRALFDTLVAATNGEARVRLDANGSWDRRLARQQTSGLPADNVVFIEQPFPVGDLDSSCWLRQQSGFAVALDEGADSPAEVARIAAAQAADLIVVKPMFRGLGAALELARVAAEHGMGTCFTHAMDGTVGRLATLQVAAACADLQQDRSWPHGLFAQGLPCLADEPTLVADRLQLPDAPGIGCTGLRDEELEVVAQGAGGHSFPDLLAGFARRAPEFPALVTADGQVVSAAELDRACDAAVSHLHTLGVKAGSVVGLDGAPTPKWLAALLACWRIGAVAAPLNHRSPAEAQERAARAMGCQLRWSGDSDADGIATDASAERSLDTPLLRVCTSGTTGAPSCVELTAGQMLFGACASAMRLGHAADDRWLVCLPVSHVGALAAIFRCLNNRITLELHSGFDVACVSDRLDSGEVSVVSLVPAMLEAVLDYRGDGAFPPRLRAILLGGAACSERLLERCRPAGLPLALTWGMTEAGSQLATRTPGDLSPLDRGLPPLAFTTVAADAEGRLVVSGPLVRGTLRTGDHGVITAEGRVRVVGRVDAVIIRGGENIHPEEIEQVLLQYPGVAAVSVQGAQDPRLGQVPVAFVACRELDENRLRCWCRERLEGFKVPERFVRLEEMPRTDAGKIDRRALQKLI